MTAFSPDGKTFVTAFTDNTVNIWDTKTGQLIHSLENSPSILKTISYSPDGKIFVTASDDRYFITTNFWDAKSGKLLQSIKGSKKGYFRSDEISTYSPNGKTCITLYSDGDGNTGEIRDVKSKKILHSLNGHIYEIVSAKYSPDGKNIVTASKDHTAIIWDAESGALLNTLEGKKGHSNFVNSAEYSPNGEYIVTASSDHTVKIWNAKNGSLLKTIKGTKGHSDHVNSAKYSPDGENIVTASSDKTAKIWDAKSGKLLHSLKGNTYEVEFATYNPEGNIVFTISSDKTIKKWDPESAMLLDSIDLKGFSFEAFYFEEDYIISSYNSQIKINNINSGKELLQLILIDSANYIVLHPDGYFDGTPDAIEKLYFVQGLEIIPIEAYYEQFYRPNLWERIMNGEEIEKATVDFENQKPSPEIEIIAPNQNIRGVNTLTSSYNKLEVTLKLTDRGGGIDELRVFHNGKLYSSEDLEIDNKSDTLTRTFYIDLLSGINDIKITAFNKERTAKSESFKVAYTGKIQQVSNLYVLAVGINKYKKSSYQLSYAVNDAKAFIEGIEKGAKDIFGKVELISLYDQQASKQSITSAFDSIISQAKPIDVFIFYYAGHGSMSIEEKNKKPIFYLLPYEVTEMYNPEALESFAISANSLMKFSRDIKAQKQLFILDALSEWRSS